MAELNHRLSKQRSETERGGQTWESKPESSTADASHFAGIEFGKSITAQEFLRKLDDCPEEDPLCDALAEVLKARGSRSTHSIAQTQADSQRLQGLAEALADMQRDFSSEREKLSNEREEQQQLQAELQKREADISNRERELKAARAEEVTRDRARKDYPQPAWLENVEGTMNVAVVGNAGVGKSLLINKLRRSRPHSDQWAPVGVNETTMRPQVYTFPNETRARLWDLPGAGTHAFPSETYISVMGLRYFDAVIIVTAGRFTTTEISLRTELEAYSVPFFMVRSKVDIDVWNNKEDNSMAEDATARSIREDLKTQHGVENPYLVSSRDPEMYDMPRLLRDLFPGLQRQLDAHAPVFSPCEPSDGAWGDAWAMPVMYSSSLSGIQGRWQDAFGATYLIHGYDSHVTLRDGQTAIVKLVENQESVWWVGRWYINFQSVDRARHCNGELRWTPSDLSMKPLVWWWAD